MASVLEKAVTLLGATGFVVLTSSIVVVLVTGMLVLRVLAGELFLAFRALVAQGTYESKIPFGKPSNSWLIIGKNSKEYKYSTMELTSIDKIITNKEAHAAVIHFRKEKRLTHNAIQIVNPRTCLIEKKNHCIFRFLILVASNGNKDSYENILTILQNKK